MERTKRGRPRSFEPDAALDAALEAFRRRGYAGTTLADLTRATRLNRPSLYAAFGNKRALFEAVLDRYWARAARVCIPALHTTGRLADDLQRFFARFLDLFADAASGGCVVVCALPAEADAEPALRQRLATLLAQADRAVRLRLEEAQRRGDLAATADPVSLAGVLVGALFACSLRSRAGAPRPELDAIAERVVALVTGAR